MGRMTGVRFPAGAEKVKVKVKVKVKLSLCFN
jgi:hypothetical protein